MLKNLTFYRRLSHRVIRTAEKVVESDPSDLATWVSLGQYHLTMAKAAEASIYLKPLNEVRQDTVLRCTANAAAAFLSGAQPHGKYLVYMMAAKTVQSLLSKAGVQAGAPGMLLHYSPTTYGGPAVSVLDALNLAELALRRHDEHAKAGKLKIEPFFKLHSFRLKTACRLWSDPFSLHELNSEDAAALVDKLCETKFDLNKPRKKLPQSRIPIIDAASKMLAFAASDVTKLLDTEPQFAELRRKLLDVIQNTMAAMVVCILELTGHAKANYVVR
jgi:hypothetical protein